MHMYTISSVIRKNGIGEELEGDAKFEVNR